MECALNRRLSFSVLIALFSEAEPSCEFAPSVVAADAAAVGLDLLLVAPADACWLGLDPTAPAFASVPLGYSSFHDLACMSRMGYHAIHSVRLAETLTVPLRCVCNLLRKVPAGVYRWAPKNSITSFDYPSPPGHAPHPLRLLADGSGFDCYQRFARLQPGFVLSGSRINDLPFLTSPC